MERQIGPGSERKSALRIVGPGKDEQDQLKTALQHALDEARMVLPGAQALFGFQLIAVFNQRFEDLGPVLQRVHLGALCLVALAVVLVMSPAAFHRQTHPHHVTDGLLRVTTGFINAALVPLMLGLAADLYLVAVMVTGSVPFAALAAGAAVGGAGFLWFVFPRVSSAGRAR
ncbi:DUF6328 family protein [Variovorax soli]|uniref:Uncharacterized protein n=1 Tax=Variovorax soli TaxID=376815 RepID=A0ABU1NB76_9BURK|nr:DUF6328 family protein [Variovorax soli]MDR6535707.1 hypothetical protein [Variovorax soli]